MHIQWNKGIILDGQKSELFRIVLEEIKILIRRHTQQPLNIANNLIQGGLTKQSIKISYQWQQNSMFEIPN